MNSTQNENLSAARDYLLSRTITLAQLIEQRSNLVSDIQQLKIQQLKKFEMPCPSQQIYSAWCPQREHDVFKSLFNQLPQLSDITLSILSLIIEKQVQQAQNESSYPYFSQGEHLFNAESCSSLKINPILAFYYRPLLYSENQLKAWARLAVNQIPTTHS